MNLKLQPITQKQTSDFFDLYISAFPPDERRDWMNADDANDFLMKNCSVFHIMSATATIDGKEQFAGFISYWILKNDVAYIEHFAVMPHIRGKQLGSRILSEFEKMFPKTILEVELPETSEAKRRIEFYRRSGFTDWPGIQYIQPAYSSGKSPMPLMLMSKGLTLEHEDDPVILEIKQKVYGV